MKRGMTSIFLPVLILWFLLSSTLQVGAVAPIYRRDVQKILAGMERDGLFPVLHSKEFHLVKHWCKIANTIIIQTDWGYAIRQLCGKFNNDNDKAMMVLREAMELRLENLISLLRESIFHYNSKLQEYKYVAQKLEDIKSRGKPIPYELRIKWQEVVAAEGQANIRLAELLSSRFSISCELISLPDDGTRAFNESACEDYRKNFQRNLQLFLDSIVDVLEEYQDPAPKGSSGDSTNGDSTKSAQVAKLLRRARMRLVGEKEGWYERGEKEGWYERGESSALDLCRQALALDADNAATHACLRRIYDYYFELGESAMAKGDWAAAQAQFVKCLNILPEEKEASLRIAEVEIAAKQAKKDKVIELLAEATKRMSKKHFTTPADQAALDVYHEVLALDPESEAALSGLNEIYQYYWEKGESFYSKANFKKARYYFDKCLAAKSGDSSARSKLASITEKEAQQRREAEERMKEEAIRRAEVEKQKREAAARKEREEAAKREEERMKLPHGKSAGHKISVDIRRGVKLYLVWIPPGEFMMGSPVSEIGRADGEDLQHRVRIIRGFWMGKYEVTQEQWQAVMGNNPSNSKRVGNSAPVERVSWYDCQEFMRKLSQMTGYSFRLPTEAEWEYACRAGTKNALHSGQSLTSTTGRCYNLERIAWYTQNTQKPRPVGQKRHNRWGLHDMLGNVWEWCKDSYSSTSRIIRGGSYQNYAYCCRSACRSAGTSKERANYIGFRVVSDVSIIKR